MSGKRTTPVSWMDALETVPSAGSFSPGPYQRRAKRIRAGLWACLLLMPLLIAVNVVNIARGESRSPATANANSHVGYAPAAKALTEWLDSNPAPLPGGVVLGWLGGVDVATVPPPEGQQAAPVRWTTTVQSFIVRDEAGNTYRAALQVGVDPRGGEIVIGGPSLVPYPTVIADGWAGSTSPWPGVTTITEPGDAMRTSITAWAQAYTTGTAISLRIAVGDPSQDSAYQPLVGVASVQPKVLAVGSLPSGPGTVLARVELVLTWIGQPQPPKDAATKTAPPVVYDLLVERADTAAPVVTAWGAPGTGPTLRRYGNAVSGVRAPMNGPTTTVRPSATASATATSTAG